MTDQLALAFDPSIAQRFEDFHETNPHVYTTLVRIAREWITRTGRHKLGIATLFEVARWQIAIATNDPEFRLNNSYRAYFARLIMCHEPDLADVFEIRTSEADLWIASYTPRTAA